MTHLDIRPIPVSRTRGLRRDVLRPYMTLEELAAQEPPNSFAVGGFQDGELIAVGFVAPDGSEPDSWRLRGMATRPRARGRGAGTALLQALVGHALEHGATRIWCNARIRACPLYERAGFKVVSDEFEVPRIGPHYVMERREPRS